MPLREAVRTWFVISLQTFGGPAGQIAVMQHALVEKKRWIGSQRFLHALNYCMLLPGPEAQQLAIYIGWLLNGIRGGVIAGTLFVLPGIVTLLALSAIYVRFGDSSALSAVFSGLAPAVLAVVGQALWRLGRRALARPAHVVIAVGALLALAVFAVPFPAVVASAGLAGWLLGRRASRGIPGESSHVELSGPVALIADDALHVERPAGRRTAQILLAGVVTWMLPVAVVAGLTGTGSVFTKQAVFFAGAALVTFGGAYAVLSYVAQRAVDVYSWLSPADMVKGLALAETTPGPLIMVVQFVAFLGAHSHAGSVDPWLAGIVASLLTVWVTFVPSFLFIFLGAPYVERLRHSRSLTAALSGITAAAVGVIANLAVYFAIHTLFGASHGVTWGPVRLDLPDPATMQPAVFAITAAALVMTLRWRWPVLRTLAMCATLGLLAGIPQA